MKRIIYILLLLISLLAAFIFLRKDSTFTTTELRAKYELDQSDYFEWQGKNMHYAVFGNGKPVLFLHGFVGSFMNWEHVWNGFPDGYQLIVTDLPGFGLSDGLPDLNDELFIDLYASYVSDLMEHLALDSVHVIGNSMGGYIAWEVASRQPQLVDKLILVNAGGYDLDKVGRIFIRLSRSDFFDTLFARGIPFRLAKIAAVNSMAKPPTDEAARSFYELMNRKETLETASALGGSGQLSDTSRIIQIQAPTLIIWGKQDKVINVDHALLFHRDIPNSELIIYDDLGHVPMLEDPDRFLVDVLDFIAPTSSVHENHP